MQNVRAASFCTGNTFCNHNTRGEFTRLFDRSTCCIVSRLVLSCGADIGGEDDEDARGEALVQHFSRQQSGQAAVTLQQLLMQPPTQRTSDLLLCQQQGRQQLGELMRRERRT